MGEMLFVVGVVYLLVAGIAGLTVGLLSKRAWFGWCVGVAVFVILSVTIVIGD